MAVYPNVTPMGSGSTRDWTTELAPGFAYGGSASMNHSTSQGTAGSMADGMAHMSGSMAGSMAGGGAAPAQNNTAQSSAPSGSTAQGGTAPTGNVASVRAGWYPGGGYMDIIGKDIENNLPASEIGAPDSMEEVFRGSMKALLLRNVGNYVVATFLIGTQGTVSWEGILYDVGNDYLAIYQTGRDQYIVSDLYSLKYVEFYDTRRREMCEAVLNGQTSWPQGNSQPANNQMAVWGNSQPGDWQRENVQPADWRQENVQPADWRQENAQPADWRQGNTQPADWHQGNAQPADWHQGNAQPADWRHENAQPADWRQGNAQPADWRQENAQPANRQNRQTAEWENRQAAN